MIMLVPGFILILCAGLKLCAGDFACLCNYAVETPIYSAIDSSSSVIGYMREFQCSPEYTQVPVTTPGWYAVADNHHVGYIEQTGNIATQSCRGNPSPVDTVPNITTTTQTAMMSTTTMTTRLPTGQNITQAPSTTAARIITTTKVPSTTQKITKPVVTTTQTTSTKATTYTSTTTTTTTKATTQSPTTTTAAPIITHPPAAIWHPQRLYFCPPNVVSASRHNHGYIRVYAGNCYELVPYSNTWQYAEDDCKRKGGHLVHISSRNENDFILQFLDINDYDHAVWTGLNDISNEENFSWTSGDRFVWANWKLWRKNFITHHNENCVVYLPYANSAQWDDIDCRQLHPWICRYGPASANGHQVATLAPILSGHQPTTLAPFHSIIQSIMGRDIIDKNRH